jgi:hypothetical protein
VERRSSGSGGGGIFEKILEHQVVDRVMEKLLELERSRIRWGGGRGGWAQGEREQEVSIVRMGWVGVELNGDGEQRKEILDGRCFLRGESRDPLQES